MLTSCIKIGLFTPLNQYTQRTVPGNVQVRGEADPDAIVTVNENPTWRYPSLGGSAAQTSPRSGATSAQPQLRRKAAETSVEVGGGSASYFYGGDYADNAALPVFKELEIAAVVPAATPDGWDEMSAVTGRVFVAQTPEQFTYDADGNMLTDGRFRYTWNGENRLVRAQELVAPTNRNPYTVTYAYDHKGRMVSKRITENDGHDTLVKSVSYLWDGWNIIREVVRAGGDTATITDNVWGLDLDGTLQGAGGVGGLFAVQRSDCALTNSAFCILHSALYLPTYDANGNVSEYVSTNGEIVAHYDYSPFGETPIESGDLASSFTHRFSTKPWCPITGLYEYQMRKYRPEIGRWLSRDAGEDCPLNPYLMTQNAVTLFVDLLGYEKLTIKFDMAKDSSWFDKLINPNTIFTTDMATVLTSIKAAVGQYHPEGKGSCNCIDYLVLAGHGSPGAADLGEYGYSPFFINLYNALYSKYSANHEELARHWGKNEMHLSLKQMEAFAAISDYLCKGATIEFGTCSSGADTEGAALKEALEELFGPSATIILHEEPVSYYYDQVHVNPEGKKGK